MILSDEKTLEALVAGELESAVKAVRESPLAEKAAEADVPAETFEELSPVIEQQLDPESFESTSYAIDLPGYSSSSYDAGKYYDLVQGDDGQIGASMTEIYSDYQHQLLQEVQEIASNTRQGDLTNNPFIEPQVDFNQREKKNAIKLVSLTTWQAMYDGKLTFN